MPVQFLSDEWTEEAEPALLNASEAFRGRRRERDDPERDQRAGRGQAVLDAVRQGAVELAPGDAESPEATIEQDYDTAVALAKSEAQPGDSVHDREDPHQRQHDAADAAATRTLHEKFAKEMQEIDVEY